MNKGIFYTSLSAILYGCIGYFGVSLMEAGFSVCDLLLWRFLISSLMLLPCVGLLFQEERSWTPKDLICLFFIGGLFYGGGTACYFEASKIIGTGLGMVLFFTYPIFVVLLSMLFKKSSINLPTLISLALIIIGSILIAFGRGADLELDFFGLLLALASGLGYGLYVFASKEGCKGISPLLSAWVVCAGNTATFCLYAFLVQGDVFFPSSAAVWMDIGCFALVGTVLPIILLLRGMQTLSANKASIIGVLEPVAVLAVGALILKEEVSAWQLVGAIIILLSAIAVQFERDSLLEPASST